MINLTTFGFNTSAHYFCNFSSEMHWAVSISAKPLSSNTMQCTTPVWPHVAQTVSVVIFAEAQHNQAAMPVLERVKSSFTYLESWHARDPASSSAVNRQQVFIHGAGFDMSAEYFCRFARGEITVDRLADVLDETRMVCESPVWEYAAGQTALAIFRGFNPIAYTGTANHSGFTFLAGWDARDSSSPVEGPASGDDTLRFIGYGFDQNASYECVFLRDSETMSSAALVPGSIEKAEARCPVSEALNASVRVCTCGMASA